MAEIPANPETIIAPQALGLENEFLSGKPFGQAPLFVFFEECAYLKALQTFQLLS